MTKHRPFGVTLLAILAGILAVISAIVCLQFLGILKFNVGLFSVRYTNIWYALMWGLMVWVYVWLVQMLWKVEPQAWMFLVVITIFNLCLNAVYLIGDASFNTLAVSTLVNALILIYCMLPGVRNAFGPIK
ncbi:MAG: hypothetical protein H6Q37_201 [Chloroflexi bacterium]|nr:hypothetical protein [Chloroflexota bacterium]